MRTGRGQWIAIEGGVRHIQGQSHPIGKLVSRLTGKPGTNPQIRCGGSGCGWIEWRSIPPPQSKEGGATDGCGPRGSRGDCQGVKNVVSNITRHRGDNVPVNPGETRERCGKTGRDGRGGLPCRSFRTEHRIPGTLPRVGAFVEESNIPAIASEVDVLRLYGHAQGKGKQKREELLLHSCNGVHVDNAISFHISRILKVNPHPHLFANDFAIHINRHINKR